MESLKKYSLNLPEAEYHAYPAWSYSIIAKYAKEGFGALAKLHEHTAPTPAMEFGSLFDSMITKGKKTLEEYAVVDITVPDAERKALDFISTRTDLPLGMLDQNFVMSTLDECGYQTRWGYDARMKHLVPYIEYYDMKRSGKKLISKTDWDDAAEMYRVFRNDEYLKNLFGTKNTKDVEYIYQAQFVVDYVLDENHTIKVKIMPDLIVVNHKDKTVQPVDLKTSAMPAYSFSENFVKLRYDLQAGCYSDILAIVMDKDENYRDYTILPYLFTDISRSDKVPVTYVYDQTRGFSFTKGDKMYQYKGWQEYLSEILTYEEENAKVPSYIRTDGPNDLIDILSR